MKHLFQVLPPDFFKPLTSKYKWEYTDCILLLFHSFKSEISYGVNREIVVKLLEGYFESDDEEMSFDEQNIVRDAREKANAVIASLKACGWLEYEQEKNHQLNVVLCEYAIPMIEAMNRIIREEEAEYQGIISQIHASLQNKDLYTKPYELIIKGVKENIRCDITNRSFDFLDDVLVSHRQISPKGDIAVSVRRCRLNH